ncbi:antimicrobial peptide THP2-like [Carettochelys insculpta]|uniref:antimicrobial peptide THP2-like n=1 Tax=Carettochelys insculpta TaxID=44489 RepID=UPI003EBEA54D
MKILYLLFTVAFLVLMEAPGFSQGWISRKTCRRRGGSCHFWRCPSFTFYVDKCIIGHCCRSGKGIANDNPQAAWSSEENF